MANNSSPLFVNLDDKIDFERKPWPIGIFWKIIFSIIAGWVWFKKLFVRNLKTNFYFFDGKSRLCRAVKDNATNWRALDIVYNYRLNWDRENALGNLIYNFYWKNLDNTQALRNRLKIVKHLLRNNIENLLKEGKTVRIVSIASGSAQGVIEVMGEFKKNNIMITAILIDLDKSAHNHASLLAKKNNVKGQITFVQDKASAIARVSRNIKPNIIEMVGFIEYRPFEKAVILVKSIYDSLDNGGVFLCSQISPNIESFFMKQVSNWPMIYRKPEAMLDILKKGGFTDKDCLFFWEPFEIHFATECKKL